MEARWWQGEYDQAGALTGAVCGLCFHGCRLSVGKAGLCGVRRCGPAALESPCLGRFSSRAVDPIEKKPLAHWRPGSLIFSLGSLGCTMRCPFCQNHHIAQPKGSVPLKDLEHRQLPALVRKLGLSAVAYTYNEPALQAEYILAAAPLLREAGIASVLVTNGMFSPALVRDLAPWIEAANVDLKTFSARSYAALGGSLDVVRENIVFLARAGVHVELSMLIVPGVSEAEEDFLRAVDWIADLDADLPLHISRYFPAHRHTAPPTDIALLRRFAALAGQKLSHAHLGNVR
ncbi:MAG: radical SAM protein [Deltaproteobacteria bacterium]|jgi:pyruvate formate lyase activating enzyme|nr:radical SAM protein [Deltaproteobacteria bacterium]